MRLTFTLKPLTCNQHEMPGHGPAVLTQTNSSHSYNLTEVHGFQNLPLLIPVFKMKIILEIPTNQPN